MFRSEKLNDEYNQFDCVLYEFDVCTYTGKLLKCLQGLYIKVLSNIMLKNRWKCCLIIIIVCMWDALYFVFCKSGSGLVFSPYL